MTEPVTDPVTDICALDATTLSALLARGEVSAEEVMRDTLARIDRINPGLNALISLRDHGELMAEARAADAVPRDQERRGWLHGIPLAVKELQLVRGIRSTSGSPLFADRVPEADDPVPARMRAAGAIFLGKTNVPEFGLGSHSFNPLFGVTANPYDETRTAGGSSGGTAAALAARLMAVGDGSDQMGSLRNPAGFCNVYGFRPSFGLVRKATEGEVFLQQLSTDGPMARTVEDLARLLEIQAVPDPADPLAHPAEPYAEGLDTDVTGWRIGWLGDWGGAYPMEPGVLELCEAAVRQFEDLGCVVEEVAPPFPAEALWESWTLLRSWGVAAANGGYFQDPATRDLLKPEMVWEIERGLGYSAMDISRASGIRSDWFRALTALGRRYDALVLPTAQVWPFPKEWRWPQEIAGQAMDTYHRWMEVVVPASLAGAPALAVPAGFGEAGLPMGLQLTGPRGADRRILQLGQAWHRATDWPSRRPPALEARQRRIAVL